MTVDREDIGRFFKLHSSRFGKCLEPKMTCTQTAIRAHSIQNAQAIDLLQHENHVIALQPDFSGGTPSIEFKLIGRNKASTFTGLCSNHDHTLFIPLDTRSLDLTDEEQLFLLAYRAVTRELHAVMEGATKVQSAYSSRVERGIDSSEEISPAGMLATQHLITSYTTYLYRFENYDKALLSNQYDALEHDTIVLEQQAPVLAVSSLFSLDRILKVDDMVRIVLNIVPVSINRTYAVFSYTKNDAGKARAAVDRVLLSHGDHQKFELSKLILSSIENFLISPSHFESWTDSKRERIRMAFATTIMAGSEPEEHFDLMLF
jgi:hypothetical protein